MEPIRVATTERVIAMMDTLFVALVALVSLTRFAIAQCSWMYVSRNTVSGVAVIVLVYIVL